MATHKHHLSFADHLSLYLPNFLRPSLPRDLRPPPHTPSLPPISLDEEDAPPAPRPTPEQYSRSESGSSREVSSGDEEPEPRPYISPTTPQVVQEKQRQNRRRSFRDRNKEEAAEAVAVKAKLSKVKKSREGYHVSLILANSGSVARDHLASERTFLAYVRTSLALASTGVALVQLFTIAEVTGALQRGAPQEVLLRRFATPLGATMIMVGITILLLGCLRYFAIQTALTRGVFPASRMTVMFLVVSLSVLTGTVFGVLLKGRHSS